MLRLVLLRPGLLEYEKQYTIPVSDETQWNYVKHKQLGIFIQPTTDVQGSESSISITAPIRYRVDESNYYIDILFTNEFITNMAEYTCIVKS